MDSNATTPTRPDHELHDADNCELGYDFASYMTANIIPNFSDSQTKIFPVFSITSKARLSNVSP